MNLKDKNFNLTSQLTLSEFKFNSPEYFKNFIPNLDKFTYLKDQKIEINFDKKGLTVNGLGKIKLVNDFENIKFDILKFENEFNFNTQLGLKKTLIEIDYLNFKKTDNLVTQINILGNYNGSDKLNFKDLI